MFVLVTVNCILGYFDSIFECLDRDLMLVICTEGVHAVYSLVVQQ